MKNQPSKTGRGTRQVPLDHLRPGGRRGDEPAPAHESTREPKTPPGAAAAQPADPATPGAGKGDAERGKATGSPAAVATRRHLEDSGQSSR